MNPLEILLTDSLLRTGHVNNACIINKNLNGKLIASTNGFALSNDQVDSIIASFKTPSSVRENDFYFSGRKFECIRADKEAIYAKHGKSGVVLMQTDQLIVLATYNEHMFPAVAVESVEKLCHYFKEKGK